MAAHESTKNREPEHIEHPESTLLLPIEECHRCVKNSASNRTPHVFKTIVLVALAYICFLETNTRLAVQNPEKQIYLSEKIPYCRSTLVPFVQSFINIVLADQCPAPANHVIQYMPRRIWQDGDWSRYERKPGPELDALWNELLTGKCTQMTPGQSSLLTFARTNNSHLQRGDGSPRREFHQPRRAHRW